MELTYFICLSTFLGLYLAFVLVYLIDQFQDKIDPGPWMFRVNYSVILHDLVSGESMRSSAHQETEAWGETDAIGKIKEILAIRTERESKDFGVSPYEYSEFQATKL